MEQAQEAQDRPAAQEPHKAQAQALSSCLEAWCLLVCVYVLRRQVVVDGGSACGPILPAIDRRVCSGKLVLSTAIVRPTQNFESPHMIGCVCCWCVVLWVVIVTLCGQEFSACRVVCHDLTSHTNTSCV